nr:scaffold protein salvador [Hymenolepis microstoma]
MLAMHQHNQSSTTPKSASSINPDPLAALQQRPFSWYLHRTTAPSSPASSTVNLFLDDNDSMNAEGSDSGRSTCRDNGDDAGRQKSASESGSHPPILPAGFRNFTRYLDTKFGPDTTDEQRSKRHHHYQRKHRRELMEGSSHTTNASDSSRGLNVTDVRPKISITHCASDGDFSESSSRQPGVNSNGSTSSLKVDEGELAHRLAATWCAPYWCPPPLPPSAAWYHQVAPHVPPLPPPPPPPRYYAPPPQNTAAACWFRAAANHFATAAAIFAADNAAAASAMAVAPVSQTHSNRKGHPTLSPRNPSLNSSSSVNQLQSRQYVPGRDNEADEEDEDDFFVVSDEEDQQQARRRRQRRLPAVEPLQRQLWGSRGSDTESPSVGSGNQTTEDVECGLDMLPQDPALILPDQVDFYAQIKDLLELDSNISLPLPAGWAVGVSSSGRRFYVSCPSGDTGSSRNRTRTTTWQHPVIAPRIPLGWERVEMRRGNCVYYRHLLIPHTQRHHPDLWFPTSMKNVEFEHQSWFFDLRKLQESVSNFDKGNSQFIESYVDTNELSEEARFAELLKRYGVGELENLLKHLDCRFFRDLHRMVVAFEVARIRIVRELFVQHIQRTNANVVEVANSHANPESSQSA